jgi:GNAT superfamily N-acetyltransferase
MADRLTFRPVDAHTRDDFVQLFEQPGGPSYCWCMAWRVTPEEAKTRKGSERRPFMLARIDAGISVGLLAYDGPQPVAWVSVAPRDTYRGLGGPAAEPGETVWSLACLYLKRSLRGQGLTSELLAGVIAHAREQGATVLEAYPVEPDSPSYRHMGFVPAFAAQGFIEIGMAGTRRHVMRLTL